MNDRDNMCESGVGMMPRLRKTPDDIPFERRKQIMKQSMELSDQIVASGLQPIELECLLGNIHSLLHKREF